MTTELRDIPLMQSLGSFPSNMSSVEKEILVTTCAKHSREFFIWRDIDGIIKFISASCLLLTGYSAEDFINNNDTLLEIIHPDDHDMWIERHRHDDHNNVQVRFIKPSGEVCWFEHNCTPIFNSKGEIESFIGNFIDITEIKTTESNNQKLATAVEQNCCGIVITDHHGVIEYINPAFSAMQSGSILLSAGDTLPLLNKNHGKIDEIISVLEKEVMWKEDRAEAMGQWYTTRISPIFDEHEQLINFLIEKVDISQQVVDKERVVEQHEELQALFKLVETGKREWEWSLDCINDVVILTNSAGIVQRANRTIEKMLSIEISDFIGNDWKSILPEHILKQDNLPTEGQFYDSKQNKWLRYHMFILSDPQIETNVKQIITLHDETTVRKMNHDLTNAYDHLKSTQSQMVHQEKMASIGQLAAGVAHEINNPTGFITSNLVSLKKYTSRLIDHIKFLEQSLEPLSDSELTQKLKAQQKKIKLSFIQEDIDDLVNESLEGAERIKVIVQNLKSFSRVDDTATTTVDLHECLDSALSIGYNEVKYKASVEKDYQPIPRTYCSAQQLNQVFLNMLVNAAQAIDEQGVITVSTFEQDGWIVIKISDTGDGIPEENMSQIFDPFYTTKEVGQGTGLGLSICYDIIQNHNGEISVDSKVGEGTTFTIKLPVISERPEKNGDPDNAGH